MNRACVNSNFLGMKTLLERRAQADRPRDDIRQYSQASVEGGWQSQPGHITVKTRDL